MTKRILISFAHPDDETFGLGGLIARYASEGIGVNLICATNGDAGTVSPEMMEGYCSVADLRLAELECAVQRLGVSRVFKFNYKDSGMMGDEVFFAGVHHKRQAGDIGIVLEGKFKEFRQQGDGHVVDAVEACIFHHVQGRAFARSGKTGNDENFFARHRYRIGRGVRILGLLL